MSSIVELHLRYRSIIMGSFSKQDPFTVRKAIARSKKVLPRGRKVYHNIVEREATNRSKIK
jgi:hypothetical protein